MSDIYAQPDKDDDDATLFADLDNLAPDDSEDTSEDLENAFKLPEKFAGKSLEDVVKSYTELETAYGKQANDFGDLRKLADKALFDRMDPPASAVDEEPLEAVTFDDLVEDPDKAVDKLVSRKLESINDKLDQFEKKERLNQFQVKFPNYNADMTDENFQTWVQGSKYRTNLFLQANEYNTDAAEELWSEWGERKAIMSEKIEKAKKDKQNKEERGLRRASSETGSTGARTREVFKRVDLINQRATDPDKYWSNIETYKLAYKEGRVK